MRFHGLDAERALGSAGISSHTSWNSRAVQEIPVSPGAPLWHEGLGNLLTVNPLKHVGKTY